MRRRWKWKQVQGSALNRSMHFPCGSLPLQTLACCIEGSGLMGILAANPPPCFAAALSHAVPAVVSSGSST